MIPIFPIALGHWATTPIQHQWRGTTPAHLQGTNLKHINTGSTQGRKAAAPLPGYICCPAGACSTRRRILPPRAGVEERGGKELDPLSPPRGRLVTDFTWCDDFVFFRMHLHGLHNRQNIKIILEYVWRNMVKDRYDVYDVYIYIFDMCCIASSFSYKSWCVHNVCTANKEPQTPDGSANLRLVQGAAIRPHSCGKMALEVPLESRCCHS